MYEWKPTGLKKGETLLAHYYTNMKIIESEYHMQTHGSKKRYYSNTYLKFLPNMTLQKKNRIWKWCIIRCDADNSKDEEVLSSHKKLETAGLDLCDKTVGIRFNFAFKEYYIKWDRKIEKWVVIGLPR